jgi:hypothetical protein
VVLKDSISLPKRWNISWYLSCALSGIISIADGRRPSIVAATGRIGDGDIVIVVGATMVVVTIAVSGSRAGGSRLIATVLFRHIDRLGGHNQARADMLEDDRRSACLGFSSTKKIPINNFAKTLPRRHVVLQAQLLVRFWLVNTEPGQLFANDSCKISLSCK